MSTLHLVPPDLCARYHVKEWRNAAGVLATACPGEWQDIQMEWNKDPFFDRDLNNFRLLFDLRAIQVGVVITRSWELQALFKQLGKGTSYGKATTHHEKLWPKIEGGGGGGCPVLTFAIRPVNFEDDGPEALDALKARMAAEKGAGRRAPRRRSR